MKKRLFIIALTSFIFLSCDNEKKSDQNVDNLQQKEIDITTEETSVQADDIIESGIVVFFESIGEIFSVKLLTEKKNIGSHRKVKGDVIIRIENDNGSVFEQTFYMKTSYVPYYINDNFFSAVFYDMEKYTCEVVIFDNINKIFKSYLSGVHFIGSLAIIESSLFFTTENYDSNLKRIDLVSDSIYDLKYKDESLNGPLYLYNTKLYVPYRENEDKFIQLLDGEFGPPIIIDIPANSRINDLIKDNFFEGN